MELKIYNLQYTPWSKMLPKLVEKIWKQQRRIVIHTSPEARESINVALWTYKPNSFLPHGSFEDGQPESQPIWVTDKVENPNQANVFISSEALLDKDQAQSLGFESLVLLFENDNEILKEQAEKCRSLENITVKLWQETEAGWEEQTSNP